MAILVNLNHDTVRSKVHADVWTAFGTTAFHGFIENECDVLAKDGLNRIGNIVFFEAIASWNLLVWMENTVAGEAVRFIARVADIDELTVLTGT